MKVIDAEAIQFGGRIPGVIYRSPRNGPRPAVIYLPGGGQTKHDVSPEDCEAARAAGISVISFDMHEHGDRQPTERPEEEPASLDRFLEFIEVTNDNLRIVIGHLRHDEAIDSARLGMRGISLSGSAMLSAIAQGLNVRACLAICSAGDFAAAAFWRLRGNGLTMEDAAEALRRASSRLRILDPLHAPERFPPCSLQMVHGVFDESVPYVAGHALWVALAPYYADRPQDCVFLSDAGRHGVRPIVRHVAWTWLLERVTS